MDGAMFKVSRYQKYVVGPLLLQERQEIINNSHVNGGSRICFKKADKVGGLGAALRPQVGPGQISKRDSGVKPPKAHSLNEATMRKTYLALWFFNCRIEALHQRTLGPRQGGLETLDQINDAPRHDCIIVKRHIERDCSGSQPHSLEIRGDLVPRADRSFPQTLPDRKLQVKQWDTLYGQHHCIGNQESSCDWKKKMWNCCLQSLLGEMFDSINFI